MNKKSLTLIISAAVLALLVGGLYFAQQWQKKQNTASAYDPYDFNYERLPLTEISAYDLAKINIVSSGIVLEMIDDEWKLTSPRVNFSIEQSAVLSRLWSMGYLSADKIIEEEPSDLSQYGLDNPEIHAILSDLDGNETEVFFGDMTPGRDAYYAMAKGDPKVYTVWYYSAQNFIFDINDLRNRWLLDEFDPQTFIHLIIERPDYKIEIVPRTESYPFVSEFCAYVMISPFARPRGTDSDRFGALVESLNEIYIGEFIDDDPVSFAPYGLDKPGRVYLDVYYDEMDLQFGRGTDGRYYFKHPDSPQVFTVPSLEGLVETVPFTIMDKFIQIHFIDNVTDITIAGGGRTIRAELQGTSDDSVFFLNGRRCADQEFRKFYQAVIGLLVDAEYTGGALPSGGDNIVCTFNFDNAPSSTVTLIPYNRDFYVVDLDGVREFMVSRSQVQNMFDMADRMVYEN